MRTITRQEVDELYETMRASTEASCVARTNLSVAQRRFAAARNAQKIASKKWCDAFEKLQEQEASK